MAEEEACEGALGWGEGEARWVGLVVLSGMKGEGRMGLAGILGVV